MSSERSDKTGCKADRNKSKIKIFDMKTMLGQTNLKYAHTLKKNLDELVDAAKLADAGATGNTIRSIAAMRRQINDILGEVDAYGAVNGELSHISWNK